jgi:hypothetical protein
MRASPTPVQEEDLTPGAHLLNTCQHLVEIASRSHILPGPVNPRANLLINHTASPGEQQTQLYRARAVKREDRTEPIARRVAARDAVVGINAPGKPRSLDVSDGSTW